jgi:hypothetical protein
MRSKLFAPLVIFGSVAGLLFVLAEAQPSKAQSAQAAHPAPQILVLKATEVDLSPPPTPGQPRAPIPLPRHFANPTLIGQVKAALAAPMKSSKGSTGSGNSGHHGKPTPTPTPTSTSTSTPTPTPTPTPSPTPSTAPISSGVSSPVAMTTSFAGMNLYSGGGYVPPDTTVAAGGTNVVEVVNAFGSVYNTAGSLLANLNDAACTTNSSTDSVSDPRVLFDTASGRWFISTTTFSPIGDASWNLLFSSGSDPTTATWYCLIIPTSNIRNSDGSTGNFADFPKLGINADKVVLTGDAYSPLGPFAQNYKFQGTEFVVINKSELINLSSNIHTALFAPDQGDYAIEPAQELTPSSTTDAFYMAAVNSALASTSTLDVWEIDGVPGVSTLQTKITSLPIGTISIPPNAQQEGTSVLIDTNDDSLLDAAFRDGTPGSLWVSANDACTPTGDSAVRSCLRFINVSIDASGLSVAQDFDYADPGMYYYYPAIRTDSAGNLFAAFSGSSTSSYASAYAAMQSAGSNNVLTNLSSIGAGNAPYTISPPRWGDYSGAGVDPSGSSVWLGAEYATRIPILGSYWGTAIANAQP